LFYTIVLQLKSSAMPTTHIVSSIDILQKKEYTYTYENGRISRAAESAITLSGEIVTAKNLVNSILYSYDSEGKLTKKRIIPVGGAEQIIYYENTDDNSVVKFKAGGKTVTSHSKTDSFGRKVFDELQLGTGFVSRQFHYHSGDVTEEHVANEKLKSSATTQLVSQIVLSGGRTISYEYDAEERITKVTDSVDGVTEYTYDALSQLLTETVNGVAKNTMVYDNYGNIKSKNGVSYTYGDGVWKDLLTKVGDKTISYDKQGNPVNYLGHTLTWEKGRQLKSFDSNIYTYNANGIRTSKTVSGVKHTYTLDGAKILRETWDGNSLIPLYDNEDSVCGILYNNVPYYFMLRNAITRVNEIKRMVSHTDSEIAEIDKRIGELVQQNSMYQMLIEQGMMDEVTYAESTGKVDRQLAKLRDQRKIIISKDDDERSIDEIRQLRNMLDAAPPAILTFDQKLFDMMIKKVIVEENGMLTFELKSGIRLREAIAWN